MVRSITFMVDDLAFIRALDNQDERLVQLDELLKELTAELEPDDTINVEMSEDLIEQLLIAENVWTDDSGIINHMAIIFHHDFIP